VIASEYIDHLVLFRRNVYNIIPVGEASRIESMSVRVIVLLAILVALEWNGSNAISPSEDVESRSKERLDDASVHMFDGSTRHYRHTPKRTLTAKRTPTAKRTLTGTQNKSRF